MAGIGEKPIMRSGPYCLDRIGVGRRDDLGDLVPGRAHEAAEAALARIGFALLRVLDDRGPGGDRRAQHARLAPQLQKPRTHQRVLHPVAGIEIPGVAGAARTAARLVVRQLRPRARIVGLLRLPGDDAALDVDLPRARAGAVGAVGGAHDLVVLPALAVAVLPPAVLAGGDAVPVGEFAGDAVEERQAIEKVAHSDMSLTLPLVAGGGPSSRRAAAGVYCCPAAPRGATATGASFSEWVVRRRMTVRTRAITARPT